MSEHDDAAGVWGKSEHALEQDIVNGYAGGYPPRPISRAGGHPVTGGKALAG
jgi:hypothetical protein